ncbi:hypothetical protein CY34DRAFT_10887 [Suillus luteus UH-Slu-Lm8-n1]|uniref:Secreted protein n=1 Tax=Suillus luteus UH-Slu-Lm8-n1 TaxID=930992 RepID=A0A0D0BEU8_9AGAM|nr:hypothetical protein CY34DRAFT_10887 [Suillus luteus UH-Slu-Lm8-n1]
MHHIGAILLIHILLQRLSMNAAIRFRTLPFSSQVLARAPSDWEEHSLSVPIPIPTVTALKSKPLTIIHHLASLTTPTAEHLFHITLLHGLAITPGTTAYAKPSQTLK